MMKIFITAISMILTFTTLAFGQEEGSKPAKVSGKIIFEGEKIPNPGLLKTNEDIDYCGETVPSEHLLIDEASKGIKNAVIALTPKDPLLKSAQTPRTSVDALVSFHCQFAPHVMTLKKGDPIYIKNGDPVPHSYHFYKDGKSLFNLAVSPGAKTIKKIISQEGVIQVKCDIHEFMEGFLIVDPAPFIIVTKEDGAFDFGDIPPGNYVFSVWQETFNRLVSELNFKPGENRYLPLGVKPN